MGASDGVILGANDRVGTKLGRRVVGRMLGAVVGVEGLAVRTYVGKVETASKQLLDPA